MSEIDQNSKLEEEVGGTKTVQNLNSNFNQLNLN